MLDGWPLCLLGVWCLREWHDNDNDNNTRRSEQVADRVRVLSALSSGPHSLHRRRICQLSSFCVRGGAPTRPAACDAWGPSAIAASKRINENHQAKDNVHPYPKLFDEGLQLRGKCRAVFSARLDGRANVILAQKVEPRALRGGDVECLLLRRVERADAEERVERAEHEALSAGDAVDTAECPALVALHVREPQALREVRVNEAGEEVLECGSE